MNNSKEHSKQVKKLLLLILAISIGFLVGIIPATIYMERYETFFTIYMIILTIGYFSGMIYIIVKSYQLNLKKRLDKSTAMIEKLKQLNPIDSGGNFVTFNNIPIRIDVNGIYYDQRFYNFEQFQFAFTIQNIMKTFSSDKEYVILLSDGEEIDDKIELSGELYKYIKDFNIPVINQENLDYLMEHTEEAIKQSFSVFANLQSNQFFNFAKDSKEEKKMKKIGWKNSTKLASIMLFIFGVSILFMWLANSESGLAISDTFTFDLLFKIFYTIIIVSLIFVKNKKVKLPTKLLFAAYIIYYWIYLFFLTNRFDYVMNGVFGIAFVVLEFTIYKEKKYRNKSSSRGTIFALILFLRNLLTSSTISLVNESKPLTMTIILTFIICPIIAYIMIKIWKREKENARNTDQKKNRMLKATIVMSVIFVPLLVGVFSYFTLIGLNYALDTSNPQIQNYIIIDMDIDSSSNSTTYTITCLVDENEVDVNISASDYYDLAIGDYVNLSLYQGAFLWNYYFYE